MLLVSKAKIEQMNKFGGAHPKNFCKVHFIKLDHEGKCRRCERRTFQDRRNNYYAR